MGFTAEGQMDPKRVAGRDRSLGLATAAIQRRRASLPDPLVDPEADAWRLGPALQLELKPQGPPPVQRIPMH
jgi:hypothetical protein